METINSVVTSATKAIWGEQNPSTTASTTAGNETAGQEPVSGLQGKGSATEPFDQGNAPNPTTTIGKADVNDTPSTSLADRTGSNPFSTSESSEHLTSKSEPSAFKSEPSTLSTESSTSKDEPSTFRSESSTFQSEPTTTKSESSTSKPEPSMSNTDTPAPTAAEIPHNPHNAAAGGGPNPLENTEGTGVTGSSAQKYTPAGGDVVPSNASSNPGAAPSSGAAPGQKQQGADRPEDEPPTSSAKEDDADTIMKKRDPNDHSGEPMHMHDGPEKLPDTQAGRRESKVGNPGGQEHGAEPKGTGEEWVRTTGVHADGGDFDATKPGAGREADRILEEKGIHRDDKGQMDNPDAAGTGEDSSKGKVSKVAKLKEKLHIGGSKDK